MNLITLDQLKNKDKFFDFCKKASQDSKQPAACNMWDVDWIEKTHTLPYLIFKENRFKNPNGEFFLIQDSENIIGCSGVYISEFSKEVAIAGCRTWINPDYRNRSLPREYFLPAQKEWAIANKCKAIALSFNNYNKNIIEIWKRIRIGERRSPRQPHHLFYSNFEEVKFMVNIQYTPQWVIYEKLDSTLKFDWHSIRVDKTLD